jgi:hypothetical protein
MPYDVAKRGKKWIVHGPNGHVFGEHDSEAGARRQQAAIYANAPPEKEDEPAATRVLSKYLR